jgi:hypothetical protein
VPPTSRRASTSCPNCIEIKHDGYRSRPVVIFEHPADHPQRQRLDDPLPVGEAVNHLNVRSSLIDGEVVCCDEKGVAAFHNRTDHSPPSQQGIPDAAPPLQQKRHPRSPAGMKRHWRVVLLRHKGEILGTVEAPDVASAKAAAAVQFELDDVQRNRIVVQELA